MLEKPSKGSPCNGCGVCCLAEPCPVSKEIFKLPECPALEHDGTRYNCGLMIRPDRYLDLDSPQNYDGSGYIPIAIFALGNDFVAKYFRCLIGADVGVGCDSDD